MNLRKKVTRLGLELSPAEFNLLYELLKSDSGAVQAKQIIDEHVLSKNNFKNKLKSFSAELIKNYENPFFLTLTVNPKYEGFKANLEANKFIERLSKSVFKRAYKRFGKHLEVVFVAGGINEDHLHLVLDKPFWLEQLNFEQLIQECWSFGRYHIQGINKDEVELVGSYLVKNMSESNTSEIRF